MDDAVAKVMLKREKDIYKMEITAMFNRSFIRAEVSGENMYDNIDIFAQDRKADSEEQGKAP